MIVKGGEEEACLYGTEYYWLEDAVVGVLVGGMEKARGIMEHGRDRMLRRRRRVRRCARG